MYTQEELANMSEAELEQAMLSEQWLWGEQQTVETLTPEEGEVTDATEPQGEPSDPVSEDPNKPTTSAPRYLRQNNALKQELAEKEAEIEKLRQSNGWEINEDLINSIVEKKLAEAQSKQELDQSDKAFYQQNPNAQEYKDDIQSMSEQHPTLSLDAIYKLVLADKNPSALLDEATKNKMSHKDSLKGRDVNWMPSRKNDDPTTWSDAEQEEYINKTYSMGGGY
jgi:hypothetical protein